VKRTELAKEKMQASWSGRDEEEQGNYGIKLAPRPELMGRLGYPWEQSSRGGGQKEKQRTCKILSGRVSISEMA